MIFSWANTPETIKAAADFFVKHVTTAYISHGEIQSGRATDFNHWSPEAIDVLIEEFTAPDSHLAIASEDGEIRIISFMTIFKSHRVCFAVFEDILTHPDHRKQGHGTAFYQWIEKEMIAKGVTQLFLESGAKNKKAHPFLKSLGFENCSVVMTKKLT